jgi:two-component system, NarL family, sensor kinase
VNEDPRLVGSRPLSASFDGSGFVEHFETLISALPEQIALVDEQWTILAVNPAWTRTASLYGYEALRPGTNYAAFCKDRADEGHNAARPAVDGISEIDAGERSSFHYLYDGNDRWEGHTFRLTINRFSIEGRTLATITRYDITELLHLRREAEIVGHSVMETQAEERRRIAREIHDSTQQLLVSVALGLGELRRSASIRQARIVVGELEPVLAEIQREIRSISYLSHPPSLESLGLTRALEQLVTGFGRRIGVTASFRVEGSETFDRSSAMTAIYRIAQEALSNVHRHAHATKVDVRLSFRKSMVHLVTTDDGVGMPSPVPIGVGLSGMKARLAELGGRLFVNRVTTGTTVIASLPRSARIRPSGDLAA